MTQIETPQGTVNLRELASIAEMSAAEELQRGVWGAAIIPHPKELLIPVQHEGGLLAGAFEPGGELIGLVFSFPTRDPAVQHSQILATHPAWRGLGLGTRLKWYQREWCLARGIQRLRWTVDPLRAANAALNIRHLGGTASTYLPDYYGEMQGIDAGAPTDRLLLEWELRAAQVARRAAGDLPPDDGFPAAEWINAIVAGQPADPRLECSAAALRLHLPVDFVRLSEQDPALALAWRAQTRALFQHYFSRGYQVTGFSRLAGPAYLLERKSAVDGD